MSHILITDDDVHIGNMLEEGLSEPITFTQYPKDDMYLLNLRLKVNEAIKTAVSQAP